MAAVARRRCNLAGLVMIVATGAPGCQEVALAVPIDATEKSVSKTLVAEAAGRYSVWAHYNIDPPRDGAPRFCHELQLAIVSGGEVVGQQRCYGFPSQTCKNGGGRTTGRCKSDCLVKVRSAGSVTIEAKLVNTGVRCEPGPTIGERRVACGRPHDNCFHALTHPTTQLNAYDLTLVRE